MVTAKPILTACGPSPDISPLRLPDPPSSPTLSLLSLNSAHSLWEGEDSAETASVADTADSCCSATCCPFPDGKPPAISDASYPPTVCAAPVVVPESAFSPLIIVGAGPHALALAARLSEPRPAALYSDLEHARLTWLQREERERQETPERRSTRAKRQTVKGHWRARKLVDPSTSTLARSMGKASTEYDGGDGDAPSERQPVQVLDNSGSRWMTRWNSFFHGLGIKHLRSPMLFHPSPADANALVAYAARTGKEDELLPIHRVVGAEFSKHQRKKRPQRVGRAAMINEREREDYFRPSTSLFRSFIRDDLVDRYSTAPLVAHTNVTAISYETVHVPGTEPQPAFAVRSTKPDGTDEVRAAKAVVLAIGPSSVPNVPRVIKDALPVSSPSASAHDGQGDEPGSPWSKDTICSPGWCHSAAFAMPGCRPLDGPLGERVRAGLPTRVVVLGGGLTSAQIVDSLLEGGVTHLTLLSRSHIKVKAFDFPLEWVSKYANLEKMAFYGESCPYARYDMIRKARDGGSVNSHSYSVLKRHVKSGRLDLRTLTEVQRAEYDSDRTDGKWSLEIRTRVDEKSKKQGDALNSTQNWTDNMLSDIDFVVCATGSTLDLAQVACMRPMLDRYPVELVQGLPRLTSDLQWRDNVPLFVCGAYAMLELGPDALNLSGTRPGAERIAHRLGTLGIFDDVPGGGVCTVPGAPPRRRAGLARKEHRSGGEGNFFDGLDVEG